MMVSSKLPVTRAGLKAPPWPASNRLADLVEATRRAITEPWVLRRSLVAELAKSHALLEYDAADYGSVFVLLRAVRGGKAFVRILRVELKF
ncbi:unnamed protein product, partial [Phaeothamnion confervicola]